MKILFYDYIKNYEKTKNKLHINIKNAKQTGRKQASEIYRNFKHPIDTYFEKIYETKELSDTELIEFSICFLELDPFFYRSGYIKEVILTKIKRAEIDENQTIRLRNVLINIIKKSTKREFKYYCRLAIVVYNEGLIQFLLKIIKKENQNEMARAKWMYNQIQKHKI